MSPGTQAVGSDYYRNLSSADFASLPLDEWFGECRFWYLPTSLDLYFAGVRKGKTPQERGVLPSSHDVEALTSLMPWGHKLVRYPLRWASRHGEGHRFQDRAPLYWRAVLAFGEVAGRLAPGVFRRSRPNG
jgi:hypothetical protein